EQLSSSIPPRVCSHASPGIRHAIFNCHLSSQFIFASHTSPFQKQEHKLVACALRGHVVAIEMKEAGRCWAEIDRNALRHNAKVVRDRIGSAEMLAVVKANAYGHGLVGVAQTLADDAQLFGVANVQEALALREVVSHPVIILAPATPEEGSIIGQC